MANLKDKFAEWGGWQWLYNGKKGCVFGIEVITISIQSLVSSIQQVEG